MTNKTYAELLAQGGGGAAAGGWSRAIFSSATIVFAENGFVQMSIVGAGGSGGAGASGTYSASGGNSAPWGRKRIAVVAGDSLVINLAAGGVQPANSSPGVAGGVSTVALNGSTLMTIQGGEGGVIAAGTALAQSPVPSATVTGADFWVGGVRAGDAKSTAGVCFSGGAAVDILQSGLGRSPDALGSSVTGVGGSVGNNIGGVPFSWVAVADWGLVITDGGTATATNGAVGRGGAGAGIAAGAFAGGGGGATAQSRGGVGAGGGGVNNGTPLAGGGNAYAYLVFTPLQ